MDPKYHGFGFQTDYTQILRQELAKIGFSLVRYGTADVFQILNAKQKPTGWIFSNKTDITGIAKRKPLHLGL
jgi:hypothetical protein